MDRPKLTISILISRNYEGVKRCLDSVRPILEQVPSELILTDTGCGPKVRELIEGYTDNIIDFEWIKDFSAARNVGLEEAKKNGSEWFLYIDDDEWFDDVSELVRFFNSEECDRYNVAAYIQRNYFDMEAKTYGDHNVDRIIRISPRLHFEHRIHEAYTGIDIGKKKRLGTIAHHFGYAYSSEEERVAKSKRNRELLELECREYPEDMRIRHQLMMDYYALNQYDEAINCALEGIKMKSDSMYWDALHSDLLYCLQMQHKWDELIGYGERFLNDKLFHFDEFGVKQYLICAYWSVGRTDAVCKMSPEVINTYIDYKKNPDKYDANQLMRDEFWQEDNISRMLLFIIDSALANENEEVIECLQKVSIREDMKKLSQIEQYRTWLIQMVLGTCTQIKQIELFYRLPSAGDVAGVNLEQFVEQIDKIFPLISLDKFDMWREWLVSKIKPKSAQEEYLKAKCYDYILRSLAYRISGKDEVEILEYVLENMTGFADSMMYYCEAKYGDRLADMTMDELSELEAVSWEINNLVNSVDSGDISSSNNAIDRINTLVPQWPDATRFLPLYVRLVLG